MSHKPDIGNKEDIYALMEHFYGRLLNLPEMQPAFEGIDMHAHLPRIVHFWSFVLLDEEGYKTNVFEKHLHLPIKPELFDKWLQTFTSSVDALYEGEKADLAKQRATVLAYTFRSKWEKLHP